MKLSILEELIHVFKKQGATPDSRVYMMLNENGDCTSVIVGGVIDVKKSGNIEGFDEKALILSPNKEWFIGLGPIIAECHVGKKK